MLRYHLPETRVTLSATVSSIRGPDGGPLSSTVSDRTAEWSTHADLEFGNEFELDEDVLHDHSAGFVFTADRRLAAVEASVTSRVVDVVESAVSIAATLGPFALLDGSPETTSEQDRELSPAQRLDQLGDRDQQWVTRLAEQLVAVREEIAVQRDEFIGSLPGSDHETNVRRRLAVLVRIEARVVADLSEARRALAGRIARFTTNEKVSAELQLRHLPVARLSPSDDGGTVRGPRTVELDWGPASRVDRDITHRPTAREIWEIAGFTVARSQVSDNSTGPGGSGGIVVRTPRRAEFIRVVRDPHASSGLSDIGLIDEIFTRSVFDEGCAVDRIPFGVKLFGKRTMQLSFDADGALTGIENGSTARAVDGATTLAKAIGSLVPSSSDGSTS